MDCIVQGPGVDVDPASVPGSANNVTIDAKSEYVIECTEPLSGAVFTDSVSVEVTGSLEEI